MSLDQFRTEVTRAGELYRCQRCTFATLIPEQFASHWSNQHGQEFAAPEGEAGADATTDLIGKVPRDPKKWADAIKHVANHFKVNNLRDAVAVDYTLLAAENIPALVEVLNDWHSLKSQLAAARADREALINGKVTQDRGAWWIDIDPESDDDHPTDGYPNADEALASFREQVKP